MYRGMSGWLKLKIGPRLLSSFLIIILFTGLTGFLAVQQLAVLTATTNQLNSRHLPEVIAVAHIRSLLFQQRELEQRLVAADDPNRADDLANLASTLDSLDLDRATLLRLGSFNPDGQINQELVQSSANSRNIIALVKDNHFNEAQTLQKNKQVSLLKSLFTETSNLRKTKQLEVTTAANQVQQQSNQLTWLILGLTLFSILFSITMALLITRSLTRPLSALLNATQAITSGDSEIDLHIAPGDELGQLAASFNTLFLNLRSTIAILAYERQQTQAIIEAITDGVVLIDAQRKVLQINPAAKQLSGWPGDEALGRSCWEVLGCQGTLPGQSDDHESACPLRLAFETNSSQTVEMRAYARNGQQRWYAVSCAPLSQIAGSAELPRMVVCLHDISQFKAVEQLKSDFVAMVSHELRAPLTTVSASVETLDMLDPIGEYESYREVISILSQQTSRLRHVIEEVLKFAQVDAGRLQVHLQPISLVSFLEEQLAAIRVAWVGNDRPISLVVPEPDQIVWADKAALEIVARNLLDNANKYTPSDSPVEVIIEPCEERGHVQVRINDHGPGIPPEQLNQIFQSFSRGAHTASNWTRGYGLGLYIAREILHVHSGEIWAENRPDGGASFVFTLCSVSDPNPTARRVETEKQ